jgi:uncharacterized protein YndB with AHSA1/START domain
MSDERDDAIEVAAEVAGTPEEVWELIATGPGIATWFMPAQVDGREGGTIALRHAPGDDGVARGRITAYDPPRRLQFEEDAGDTTMATEFLVESRSGGTCVVRVVTHGIAALDDGFRDGLVAGWTQALATLRIRLAGAAGRPSAFRRVWATRGDVALDEAWDAAAGALGLAGARVGDAVGADDPRFAGVVDTVTDHGVVVRTSAPEGVLRLAGTGFGGRTSIVVDRYIYAGDDAEGAVDAEERAWRAHLGAPAPSQL